MTHKRSFRGFAAIALAITAVTACSGSPTSPPPPPPASVSFTAAANPPPANSVTLQLVTATSTTLTLNLVATDLNNLASVFFDVVFAPEVIDFQSASEGPFLATSGGSTNFQTALDMTSGTNRGRLIVSGSVLGGRAASGTGTLATLSFTRVAAGTTGMSFEASGAIQPDGTSVPGITFAGGAATAR